MPSKFLFHLTPETQNHHSPGALRLPALQQEVCSLGAGSMLTWTARFAWAEEVSRSTLPGTF